MSIGPQCLRLLAEARRIGASDLLIVAGAPPAVYVNARMRPLCDTSLGADDARRLIDELMTEQQRDTLERNRDADFSVAHSDVGRCRVNVHFQRGSPAAAIRFVPDTVPGFDGLNLPPILEELAHLPRGLVLITGGTGSGKSTTMAAMLDRINQETALHIITLEDPIEYTFTNARSIIEQREIGTDSPGFAEALRHIVRQKPDVIMVGEMRDLETIRTALTAAETGHLVLASLHTVSAAQTVERIVDVFEPAQQAQIRTQLAGTLRAVACQTLFTTADGDAMVPAVEVMVTTQAIARAIRDGETHLIAGMIETGAAQGMRTLDREILRLVSEGAITRDAALAKANNPERLAGLLDRPPEAVVARVASRARPWE